MQNMTRGGATLNIQLENIEKIQLCPSSQDNFEIISMQTTMKA